MSALQCPSAVEPSVVSHPPAAGEDGVGALAARVAGQDVTQLDGDALVDYLQDCHRLAAAFEGQKLTAAARLAEDSTHSDHGPAGSAVECAAAQVSLALVLTPRGADHLVDLGLDLQQRLPATLQQLRAGQIDPARARILSEETSTLDQATVAQVEARALSIAHRLTTGQLRARVRRMVIQADPETAQQRHADKVAERGVHLADEGDATAALSGFGLPADKALGAYQYVDSWARQLRRSETPETGQSPRSLDQIRADLFCDLLTGNAPVAPTPDSSESNTLPGTDPAPARAFTPVGRLHLTVPLETLTGQSRQPAEAAGFGSLLAEITQSLAYRELTPGSRHCWTVHDHHGNPIAHGTGTYRPAPRLRAEITARNPHCAFPTCSQPATRCDLDHTIPFTPNDPGAQAGGGSTCPCNLVPLCKRHHRLKHHPDWHTHQNPDQPHQLTWITPSGEIYYDLPPPNPDQRE